MKNKISIIIPTYNRAKAIEKTINSILEQTLTPVEIIVVDDSPNPKTKEVIKNIKTDIKIKYLRGKRSLTKARNIGVKKAKGNIILFLDDDVVLHKEYLKELNNTFNDCPDIAGAQGYVVNTKRYNKIVNAIRKIVGLTHNDKKCKVLHLLRTTYPIKPKRRLECQWLSGCNMAFKKEIFRHHSFDSNLYEYSFGEDVIFTYELYRKGFKFILNPNAKLIHLSKKEKSTKGQKLLILKIKNKIYFEKKFYGKLKMRYKIQLLAIICYAILTTTIHGDSNTKDLLQLLSYF